MLGRAEKMDSNKVPGWFALVFCLIASLGAWFNLRADRVDAEIEEQWVQVEGEVIDYRYERASGQSRHRWHPVVRYRSASGKESTVEAGWTIRQEAKPEIGQRLPVYHHPNDEAKAHVPGSKRSRQMSTLVGGLLIAAVLYVIFRWWTGRGRA